jgi:long-chain acyl-CoA synthetase
MGLRDFTIFDVINRNARLFPNGEAWVFANQMVTFQQFLNEINRLSFGLKKFGLRKGDRLGVLSQNCYEFALLYGAAAKLGAIMLPINWRLNLQEIEYILLDGAPRFLFVGTEYEALAKEIYEKANNINALITIGDIKSSCTPFFSLLEEEGQVSEVEILQTDPYLIIHTAAVAGKPRGATLSQRNIIASSIQHIATLGLREADSYLHLLPLFHIADLILAFSIMHGGGKNVIMPRFDPNLALQIIEKEKITTIGEFPPMLGMLLEKLEGQNCDLSSLRHVVGIDHPENIEKLYQKTKANFWVGFGQSETSGLVTICPYTEKPGSAGKEGPLVNIKLVDEQDREVETGNPGEICVRGPLVFLGYWNLEEDNRYTFRDDWHHTGDIGRLDENGYLWYVKRKAEKELIKPGGENVYPAEVEKIILENPDVAEVSVIGVKDLEWGEAIKAVCVLKAGSSLTQQGLIDFVASRIARFKKPKYVQFVAALPKSTDGSIDRERVKALYGKG